jgi:hypothetical protein
MYLRRCYRRKNGKRHAHWALVESHRTARGPRQRVVAYLGELDEGGRIGVKRCAEGSETIQSHLFDESEPEWVEVDLKRVRAEDSREFGGCWLSLKLLRELGLPGLLEGLLPAGREEVPWALMALVLVPGRLVDCSSELHLAEHGYEASALAELLGVPAAKVNDDRLYRALDPLLSTRRIWRNISNSGWANCSSSTTTCCYTTSPAPTLKMRRRATRRRREAIRAITGRTASKSTSRWW